MNTVPFARAGLRFLKEALFPLFCISCGSEGSILCDACFALLSFEPMLACPVCHAANESGVACMGCKEHSYIDRHVGLSAYRAESVLASIIHEFKYSYIQDAKRVFARVIERTFEGIGAALADTDLCVPVPLHRRRHAERGYNQAAIIAAMIAERIGTPMRSDVLRRVKHTGQQARLSKENRLQNMRQAFDAQRGGNISGMRVLLVDDVFTTGSTMQDAARALKEDAHAGYVMGCTLARG